jgi:hypothetical protein
MLCLANHQKGIFSLSPDGFMALPQSPGSDLSKATGKSGLLLTYMA